MKLKISESQYSFLKNLLSEQKHNLNIDDIIKNATPYQPPKPTPTKQVVKKKPQPKKPVIVTTTTTTAPIPEPTTTTTTTVAPKPKPYFDAKTERTVNVECGLTLVGQKGVNTFERIHRTKDGEKLGDYDKSLSTRDNMLKYCKK
jgi:hypothetical protein